MARSSNESELEEELLRQMRLLSLPLPEREYKFALPKRKWRFDFAWPSWKISLEVEGGTWARGRHVRGDGFENDCIKYSEAAILGWCVIRVTGGMIEDGRAADLIERAANHHQPRR